MTSTMADSDRRNESTGDCREADCLSQTLSTAARLATLARLHPDRTAIVEDGLTVDYQALAIDLAIAARDLALMGVRPGHRIGIEVRSDRYTHLLLILACHLLGAATLPLTREQLSGPDHLALGCDVLLTIGPIDSSASARVRVIVAGWARRSDVAALAPHDEALLTTAPNPDGIMAIIHSSGTTGAPKAMALTHEVQRRLIQVNVVRMTRDGLMLPVSLCLYGLAVRAVLMRVLAILHLGGTVIFSHENHAPAMLSAGLVNQAMFTVGDMERIIRRTTRPPAGHEVHVELFGAAVGQRLRETISERLTDRVRTRYSSNETGTIADMDAANLGTLGDGVAVRIVDDAGREVPPGETGLIRVRTPTMVTGYLNDPEATGAAFIDGWFVTRDLGFMPAPDRLVVLGRADDVLNIGGVKLAPAPLEDEMRRVPGITDAALLRVSDQGEAGRLLVAVETADGSLPENAERGIEAILRRHVRHYRLVPLASFPRTDTGKVRRGAIVAALSRAL